MIWFNFILGTNIVLIPFVFGYANSEREFKKTKEKVKL